MAFDSYLLLLTDHGFDSFSLRFSLFQGAFELGCIVCPIAIKYNKIFVVAFWNSKK
jgi:hypothetical protein